MMLIREDEDGLAVVRMARGQANALNRDLVIALLDQFERLHDEPSEAVILTGEERAFCAGVDLFEISTADADFIATYLRQLSDLFRLLFLFPKPVVAAINGHAVAGGCVMALACDWRIAVSEGARFCLPGSRIGVVYPPLAIELARFRVPRRYLAEALYQGAVYDPPAALERNLVDELVVPGELAGRARQLARQLATIPADTFRLTKEMLRARSLRAADRFGAGMGASLAEAWCAPDVRAAMRDYIAKTIGRKGSR